MIPSHITSQDLLEDVFMIGYKTFNGFFKKVVEILDILKILRIEFI